MRGRPVTLHKHGARARVLLLTLLGFAAGSVGVSSDAFAQACPAGKYCYYAPPGMSFSHSSTQSWNLILASSFGTVSGTYRINGGSPVAFSVTPTAPLTVPLTPSQGVVGTFERAEQRGIYIEADSDALNVTHQRDGGNEQASASIKDHTRALGTRFRAGGYSLNGDGNRSDTSYDIVSIYSPTGATVTMTAPPGAPNNFWQGASGDTVTVSLAAGETFIQRTRINRDTCNHEIDGALITSDRPISVATGGRGWGDRSGWGASCQNGGGCGDDGRDHIFPTNKIGVQYVIANYNTNNSRRVAVVADQDNTQVSVNGTIVATLAAGQTHYFRETGIHYVETSLPAYVFQNTGLSNSCELGMGFVPPVSFNSGAENYAAINVTGSGAANIVIQAIDAGTIAVTPGAGLPAPTISAPVDVPGRPDLKVVRLTGMTTGQYTVGAQGDFQIGVVSNTGPSGLFSYYNIFNVSGCGDTVVSGEEGCDDGNTTSGDGCSSACKIEIGTPGCDSDSDCVAGGLCNAAGVCVECLSDSNCNDSNSCTTDSCQADGTCSNAPVAEGTSCNAGNGVCNGDATAPACVTCIDDAPVGQDTGCFGNAPNCDTTGAAPVCRGCVIDNHCDDGNDCTVDSCNIGGGFACEHSPVSAGTSCDGGNGVCNGSTVASACETCVSDNNPNNTDPGCSTATPHCDRSGATPTCQECLTAANCGNGELCDASRTCQAAAVDITAPADGATTDNQPTISGTATTGVPVTIFIRDSNGVIIQTTTVTAFGGTWTLTPNALAADTYTVIASVNAQGGAVTDQITLTVSAPSLAITSPTNGAVLGTVNPTISGTSDAGASITITIDGSIVLTTTAAGDGLWMVQASGLSAGTHSVRADAVDTNGRPSAPVVITFTIQLGDLGDPCGTSDDCNSGFCDPNGNICACDSDNDCPIGQVCDTNESPNACEAADACGNGTVEGAEGCDDGNTADGDGCNSACLVEDGGSCTTTANCATGVCDPTSNVCEPANTCGNGILEGAEVCDDGNIANGDGCNSACLLENGESCTLSAQCASGVCDLTSGVCEPANTCGNSVLDAGEGCDDGNTANNDGCNSACLRENGESCGADGSVCASGFCDPTGGICACDGDNDCAAGEVCDTAEAPNACEPANTCGNGTIEGAEACDDSNTANGDGCNSACLREDGQGCTLSGQCASGVCDLTSNVCEPANTCGNGLVEAGEACDDGNTAGGDGCNTACLIEDGQGCALSAQCASGVCDLTSNVCEPANTCGNSVVEGAEACDDGNTTSNDGCNSACLREDGESCTLVTQCASGVCDLTSNTCEPANTCGNGLVEAGEVCDDGNTAGGDGCNAACLVENGGGCSNNSDCASNICDTTVAPGVCLPSGACGNGVLEMGETCDDMNTTAGDGCDASCAVEPGYTCSCASPVAGDCTGQLSQCADVTPPAVAISTPADGSSTSAADLVVTGTSEPGATVSVTLDGGAPTTVTAANDGSWTVTFPGVSVGQRTISATASDAANNTSAPVTSTVTVDRTAPTVLIQSPGDGIVTSDTTPTISGLTEPGATVELIINGGQPITITAANDGTWSHTPATALPEGAVTISATASDAAGNTSQPETIGITIDTTAPVVAITAPTSGSSTNELRPVISGTSEPGAEVEVVINGGQPVTVTADGNGDWTLTPGADLPEGQVSVEATASDAAGNTSAPVTTTFTIDTTAPPLSVTAPVQGSSTNEVRPAITGTTSPGSTVELVIDGGQPVTVTADASGDWTYTPDSDLAEGAHTVEATATDAGGNSSQTQTVGFEVDTTAPAVAVATPVDGNTIKDNTPTLSGTAEPGATVTLTLDGAVIGTVTADASGDWSLQIADEDALALGEHTLVAEAADAAGNTATSTSTFTVAEPDPVSITSPTAGEEVIDLTPTITGTTNPGVTVEIFIDGAKAGEAVADANGDWSFTPDTDLAEGAHTVEARTEAATSGEVSFTVTAPEAPVVTLTEPTSGPTNDPTPTYTGTGTPGATVEVIVDGQKVGETIVGEDGTWTIETPEGEPLGEGEHTIEVTATTGGGSAMLDAPVTITIDTTAPTLTITSPTDGSSPEQPVVVTGTGEPGAEVVISIDGQEVGRTTVGDDGTWRFTAPSGTTLDDGDHTIEVTSNDGAGNSATPASVTITISDEIDPETFSLKGGCSQTPGGAPSPDALLVFGALGLIGLARRRR